MKRPVENVQKRLFIAWVPLALMWLVMAAEQPAITAIIARMSDPTIQLAAFGFAFALALLIEGPIVQMLSAGTAAASDAGTYGELMRLMHSLAAILTALHLLLCIPSVFDFLALSLLQLPESLLESSYWSFVMMLPWSAAIGYRRLWQGVMIRWGRSRQVPFVMYLRMISSWLVLGAGLTILELPGAVIGGLSLSVGVLVGAISARVYAGPCIRQLSTIDEQQQMDRRQLASFYTPLALTSLISLGIRPLLNLGIAKGEMPVQSLAIWPVVMAYIFIFTSVSQSMQEIVIAASRDTEQKQIRRFCTVASVSLTLLYILSLATPFVDLWFFSISDVPDELSFLLLFSVLPLVLVPYLAGMLSLFRGLLVSSAKTRLITIGMMINAGTLFAGIILISSLFSIPGAYAASISYTLSHLTEWLFLRKAVSDH